MTKNNPAFFKEINDGVKDQVGIDLSVAQVQDLIESDETLAHQIEEFGFDQESLSCLLDVLSLKVIGKKYPSDSMLDKVADTFFENFQTRASSLGYRIIAIPKLAQETDSIEEC